MSNCRLRFTLRRNHAADFVVGGGPWILLSTSTMSDYAELWSRLESLVGGGLVGCPFLPPPGGWRLGLAMT